MKALVAMKVIGTAGSFSPAGQWVDLQGAEAELLIGVGGKISSPVPKLFGNEKCGFAWLCTKDLWVSTFE